MQSARASKAIPLFFFVIFAFAHPAYAGMTVYGLRDIYKIRLEDISFFVVLLLVCAVVFRLLWNHAVKGIDFLPKIKFLQSFCMVVVFGLLMLLILAMISGIREVLTPEAWRRQGNSYRINDPSQEPARLRSLEQLRSALLDYAHLNQGHFPIHDYTPDVPEKLWESPDQLGTHYIYFAGLTTNDTAVVLAVEPVDFGDRRFALYVSGEIKETSSEEIEQIIQKRASQ